MPCPLLFNVPVQFDILVYLYTSKLASISMLGATNQSRVLTLGFAQYPVVGVRPRTGSHYRLFIDSNTCTPRN